MPATYSKIRVTIHDHPNPARSPPPRNRLPNNDNKQASNVPAATQQRPSHPTPKISTNPNHVTASPTDEHEPPTMVWEM
ncbi:hypothetical protein L873DRAFT_1803182 [Choiromyces venosus 120613-1]|uniref:Uncharacterized protein n=1 Tax=Choiromyces venosus 120613-1 TaxID=1336337 RepID=A0A3N4JU71_9PEZI|nr:hypothetical protein L873DRAFT_1803182 [Choiromyces venosus 120613-1]